MADLVTHACIAALVGLPRGRGRAALAAIGGALPDLVSRVPGFAMEIVGIEHRLPYAVAEVGHTPIGTILWVALASQAFADRRVAASWLGVGALTHYGLDLLQDHHGMGYRLFVPLSGWRFELGVMGSEATVPFAPWLLVVTLVLALWRSRAGDEERRGTAD